jgi:hypothetical protein
MSSGTIPQYFIENYLQGISKIKKLFGKPTMGATYKGFPPDRSKKRGYP